MSIPVYASYNGKSFTIGRYDDVHPIGPVGHIETDTDPETQYTRKMYRPVNFGGSYKHPQPPASVWQRWES